MDRHSQGGSKLIRAALGAMGLVLALAAIMGAAAAGLDRAWARLRAMPPDQRLKLSANLRRFDLELAPDQRQAVRDIDERIEALAPSEQERFLGALRRYHLWLGGLAENQRETVLGQPPDRRMETVQKLLVDHAAPRVETPEFLRVAEIGEFSPFELASLYKIWRSLGPPRRAAVTRLPEERRRREKLFQLGAELKPPVPREIRPPDFDPAVWADHLKTFWRASRPVPPPDGLARRKAAPPLKPKSEAFLNEIQRRQAINLYIARARKTAPVAPDHLERFIAGLPPWEQSVLVDQAPDEARHRLAFAYRLVFPYPHEIDTEPPSPSPSPSPARPTAAPSASRPRVPTQPHAPRHAPPHPAAPRAAAPTAPF